MTALHEVTEDDVRPLVELVSDASEVETIELFSINGVSYSIPNKVRVNVQLKYMRLRKEDEANAGVWLLQTLLGDEGYDALENYDELTSDDFARVTKAAAMVVLGKTEAELEGKASPKRSGKR